MRRMFVATVNYDRQSCSNTAQACNVGMTRQQMSQWWRTRSEIYGTLCYWFVTRGSITAVKFLILKVLNTGACKKTVIAVTFSSIWWLAVSVNLPDVHENQICSEQEFAKKNCSQQKFARRICSQHRKTAHDEELCWRGWINSTAKCLASSQSAHGWRAPLNGLCRNGWNVLGRTFLIGTVTSRRTTHDEWTCKHESTALSL